MAKSEERLANELADRLRGAGVDAHVSDQRNVRAVVGDRSLKVFCIWYGEMSGLMLGMNQANARSSLGPSRRPREGAEYYVELSGGGGPQTADRTPDVEQVVSCARAWLVERRPMSEVERQTPFVRAWYRSASALAARIDRSLRYSIGGDPSYEVWVYGDGRSCKLDPVSGACSFYLGQAQVGFATLAEPSAAVSTWLIERVSIAELAARIREVTLERHADLLEVNPARWHWLHVLDRAADPDDVLAPLRELIEALAQRPQVAAFYSFSSLNRLCFSASSHYPWIDDGLPIVWRADAEYIIHTYHGVGIEPVRCDLAGAADTIERRLAASSVRPFFGSAPHHHLGPLTEALTKRGSSLRPALVQRTAWFCLEVESAGRRCEHSHSSVKLCEGDRARYVRIATVEEAAEIMCRFLEQGEALDAFAVEQAT